MAHRRRRQAAAYPKSGDPGFDIQVDGVNGGLLYRADLSAGDERGPLSREVSCC
jgi:hypothetical protein